MAAPKRFVLGCRQRAGAVSGELLIPRGADPGVPTPCLAWKVSKSLISCSAPPGLRLHPSPGDLGLPTTADRLWPAVGSPPLGCFQTSFLQGFLLPQSVQGHSQLKLGVYPALERRDGQLLWPAHNPGSWQQEIQLRLSLEMRMALPSPWAQTKDLQPAHPLCLKPELQLSASKAGGRSISLEPPIPLTIL